MNIVNKCEVCGNDHLEEVLNLGKHPLCDDLIPIGSKEICREYPVEILFCDKCKTAHQKYQPDKEIIFPEGYHYRAHFTQDVLNGMNDLVDSCTSKYGTLDGKKVLDVGCNDGSLLSFFKDKGAVCIGIEPTGAALEAEAKGICVYHEYFTLENAKKILREVGTMDFITFTNVFAHIEDLQELISSVKELLHDGSVVVIENHYLGSILRNNQFDTFYHEHPRSYSLNSFIDIARQLHCSIDDVVFPKRYGGNIRVYLRKTANEEAVLTFDSILKDEETFISQFQYMNKVVCKWINHKRQVIQQNFDKFGSLPAKAFPGRAAILIKLLQLNSDMICAVYEKQGSKKIGYYVPGTRIPILDESLFFSNAELMQKPIINLAWHISDEINRYVRFKGYKNEVIDIIDPEDFKA